PPLLPSPPPRQPPRTTLFPYTTLFRSNHGPSCPHNGFPRCPHGQYHAHHQCGSAQPIPWPVTSPHHQWRQCHLCGRSVQCTAEYLEPSLGHGSTATSLLRYQPKCLPTPRVRKRCVISWHPLSTAIFCCRGAQFQCCAWLRNPSAFHGTTSPTHAMGQSPVHRASVHKHPARNALGHYLYR